MKQPQIYVFKRVTPAGTERWVLKITNLPDGAPTHWSTHDKEGAAKAAGKELLARVARREFAKPSAITVGEWLPRWLADHKAGDELSKSTDSTYRRFIALMSEQIGRVTLQALTAEHVRKMMRALSKKHGGTLGANSVRTAFFLLAAALEGARRDRLIAFKVTDDVDPPGAEPSKRGRALEPHELAKVFAQAGGGWLAPIIELLAATGMRRGEALNLKWCDVDLGARTLRVTESKTEAGKRTLHLDDARIALLRDLCAQQQDACRSMGAVWTANAYVFAPRPDRLDEQQNGTSLTNAFTKLARRAGVAGLRLHDLRHNAASIMFRQKRSVKEVQEQLGHADPKITVGVYAHLIEEDRKAVAHGLGGAVPTAVGANLVHDAPKSNVRRLPRGRKKV